MKVPGGIFGREGGGISWERKKRQAVTAEAAGQAFTGAGQGGLA